MIRPAQPIDHHLGLDDAIEGVSEHIAAELDVEAENRNASKLTLDDSAEMFAIGGER